MKYRKKTNIFMLAAAAMLLLLAACGGGQNQQPAAVSISFTSQTYRVEAGKPVTLNVSIRGDTEVEWPVLPSSEGSLTPNGSRAVYIPVLPRTEIEKTYEITVTATADRSKRDTARVTVYFPAEHVFYYGINNSGQVIGEFRNNSDSVENVRSFVKDGDGYTVVDNPGSVGNTYAHGINDSGHVLAYYDNENRYFLKTGGIYEELEDYPGASVTEYTGINNSGQLSGHFTDSGGFYQGFIKTGGSFEIVSHPDAVTAACDNYNYWRCGTFITGINNFGMVAGYFVDSNGVYQGFVEDGGAYVSVNAAAVAAAAADLDAAVIAAGINDSGQAAGYFYTDGNSARGFVFFIDDGGFEVIDYPGASDSGVRVLGINDSGQITGWFDDGGKASGFLMQID